MAKRQFFFVHDPRVVPSDELGCAYCGHVFHAPIGTPGAELICPCCHSSPWRARLSRWRRRWSAHLDESPGAMWFYIWFGGAALMSLITWIFGLNWP